MEVLLSTMGAGEVVVAAGAAEVVCMARAEVVVASVGVLTSGPP